MEPKKIKSFRDLQMEKYRLRVSLEYTEKRLGDNWSSIKAFFTPEHLAFEAGKWITSHLAPEKETAPPKALPEKSASQKALPEKSSAEGSAGSSSGNWIALLMPFLVGALSALLQAYSAQDKE